MRLDSISAATADLLRGLWRGESPDWPGAFLSNQRFLEDLDAQGMAPLLWFKLNQAGRPPDWPVPVLKALRRRALREAAVEMARDADLEILLGAFEEKGIRPLLLKGAALSHMHYPRAGLRPRCDTDLLVPESQKEVAAALMRELGFQPLYEADVDQISAQMSWLKPGGTGVECNYDLHWRISNNDRRFARVFSHEHLSARAVDVHAMGEHARTLEPVDALVLACMHRAGHYSHSGDRLIWLYDIHLLAGALDEEKTARFCVLVRELDIEGLCGDAFAVTRHWFGTALPPPLEAMCPLTGGSEIRGYLRSGRQAGIRGFVRRELGGMSWKEGVRFIAQNLFPPPAYMRWRYASTNRLSLPWLYLKRMLQGLRILVGR
jgi:hypothetical protein